MKDVLWYIHDALSALPDDTIVTVKLLSEIIDKAEDLRAIDEQELEDSLNDIGHY